MLPVVAIVGRANVGKSTLFNALTKSKDAIVVDLPGTTRDRQYGESQVGEKPFIVIDTGGFDSNEIELESNINSQTKLAMQEADVILFVVDAKSGVSNLDLEFANSLRKIKKPKYLVVNKIDGLQEELVLADFYQLACGEPVAVTALKKRGLSKLVDKFSMDFPALDYKEEQSYPGTRVAIIGQPNVGKSTLVNKLLGEERVVVSDLSGTTRDSIFIPFMRKDKLYTLIDTAGVRRKSRVKETVEKFSVVKTLQAIESSNVVVMLIDGTKSIYDQDLSLLSFVVDAGKALVIAINKWDAADPEQQQAIKRELGYKLQFVDFAIVHFISALKGTGCNGLFASIDKAYFSATRKLETPVLTKLLEKIVAQHQLPMVQGRRIKLRYAHSGGVNPQVVVIHGNQTEHVPDSYKRYLAKSFIKSLNLKGTPVVISLKTGDNPYAGKRNVLTPRQQRSRDRLRKFIRKNKK